MAVVVVLTMVVAGVMAGRPVRRVGARRLVGQLPGAIMSEEGHRRTAMSPVEQRVAALEALLAETLPEPPPTS